VEEGVVTAVDRKEIELISQDIAGILEKHPNYKMDLEDFLKEYSEAFDTEVEIETLEKNLSHVLVLSQDEESGSRTVQLNPLRIFCREITQLLEEGGALMLANLEAAYLQKYVFSVCLNSSGLALF
jgi:hypothetical protein